MDPDSTAQNNHDGAANLITVLRICEQIQTTKENIEKNSENGECSDGIIVTY